MTYIAYTTTLLIQLTRLYYLHDLHDYLHNLHKLQDRLHDLIDLQDYMTYTT